MATMVYAKSEKCMKVVGSNDYIDICKFQEGYVYIEPWIFMDIHKVAEFVTACFEEGSNFEMVLRNRYNFEGEFKGIKFEFNKIWITVEKENADCDKIVREYFERVVK